MKICDQLGWIRMHCSLYSLSFTEHSRTNKYGGGPIFSRGLVALFCPHLCYLMSFIHLMLCNYYIISVMIMLYYVTILEMQFIAIYDND